MKLSFNKKTLDNVTVVMIAFEGLESYFQSQVGANHRRPTTWETPAKAKMDCQCNELVLLRNTSPKN